MKPILLLSLCAAILPGCGRSEAGPTYADSLQIYNAESLAMQNLRTREADLLKSLSEAEATAESLGKERREVTDPDGELAQQMLRETSLVSGAARSEAMERYSHLVDTKETGIQKRLQMTWDYEHRLSGELKQVRADMDEQQKRVDHAKMVKDAAEQSNH